MDDAGRRPTMHEVLAETARAMERLELARDNLEHALAASEDRAADSACLAVLLREKVRRLEAQLRDAGLVPLYGSKG